MQKKLVAQVKNNFDQVETVGILGWGRSGQAAAKLAYRLKKRVILSEAKKILPPEQEKDAEKAIAEAELGGHSQDFLKKAQLWIISPGIRPDSKAICALKALHIPAVSEIEFASWFFRGRILAITGTNGKTTTAKFLSHLFTLAKIDHLLLGNIGNPFSQISTEETAWVILEVSSFQLYYSVFFAPDIACLTNFSPNHLDWHRGLEDYFLAKKNIFVNQTSQGWAVFPQSLFSRLKPLSAKPFPLRGRPDAFSLAAAVAEILGILPSLLKEAKKSFSSLPHRLELVREVKGVTFVNDSKSTNVASTLWALKKIDAPIVLIAGGKDKGLDYSPLNDYYHKLKKVFLIGPAAEKIAAALSSQIDWQYQKDLPAAVEAAYNFAQPGDYVLLSPMCSSFDSFTNFEERGNAFKQKVYQLPV